ncbi:MAG TPA: hypothetical protein VK988_16425 [Acidimicrobiales bacterium]|nr:hypothetical protein [Acidimicrobiales bacterium]
MLVGRRRAVLAAVAACALLVLVALLVIRAAGPESRADLGDQSDPSSVGAAVDAAIEKGAHGALSVESSATCAAQTREGYGQGLGALVYTASLRWQGVPAVALAYRVAGERTSGLDHRVFVVSRAECRLLVAQGL